MKFFLFDLILAEPPPPLPTLAVGIHFSLVFCFFFLNLEGFVKTFGRFFTLLPLSLSFCLLVSDSQVSVHAPYLICNICYEAVLLLYSKFKRNFVNMERDQS